MPNEMLDFAMQTAREAGEILRKYFRNYRTLNAKGKRGDVVTEADLESEALVISRIREKYPHHRILAEESGLSEVEGSEYTWVIDPLDGTKNFSKHIPFFCVSIGVVREGRPVLGVVYDPLHDEMFSAAEGEGAHLNGTPISVSDLQDIDLMMINMAWSHNLEGDMDFGKCAVNTVGHTAYFRRLGAAALVKSYVACGRMDAAVSIALKPWDIVAAVMIVREAGGVATGLRGEDLDVLRPSVDVLVANPVIHRKVVEGIFSR